MKALGATWGVKSTLAALLGGVLALGCEGDFDPVSKVASVRVLAAQADKPYARPGDTVKIEVLAVDARLNKQPKLKVFPLTTPCENPIGDLYYACYLNFANSFQPGDELTAPESTDGFSFEVTLSQDVIAKHPPIAGIGPFGSVFAFSMACPGTVRYLGLRLKPSPQSPPFGCFDDSGKQLGNDSFVFAFTRIFVFEDRTNLNPEIESLTVGGKKFIASDLQRCAKAPADTACKDEQRLTLDHCTKQHVGDCPTIQVDVSVPESSQEADPSSERGREQLWVDYYATGGMFEDDIRVLYDASQSGRLSDTAVDFHKPVQRPKDPDPAKANEPSETLWAVVHDNRGGVSWVELPIDVN
jgi:hypothetical protein